MRNVDDYSRMLDRFVEILRPVLGDFTAFIYPVDERSIEIACDTADEKHYRHRISLIELSSIKNEDSLAVFAAEDFASYLYANHFIRRMPVFT